VSVEQLSKHLKKIADKEKGKISEDAIKLIAKTSEGSVRDSISLLDRALISQNTDENKVIEQNDVRQMLGLADKLKILSLFKEILSGNEQVALNCFKELLNDGIDAKNFLNDFLEVIYLFSRRISLGPIDKDMSISETEAQMIEDYSKNLDMQDLGLFWQLTVKTIDDLRLVGNENLTLEMYIMQLIYLKNLENKNLTTNKSDDALIVKQTTNDKKIEKSYADKDIKNKISEQLKSTDQLKANPIKKVSTEKQKTKIEINSLQDLINVSNDEKEIQLKYDLERNVKLVSFNKGKIDISFNEKLNKNFIKILSEKLLNWTGERWIISLSKNSDAKSIYEKSLEEKNNKIEEFKNSRVAREIEKSFPDAILTDLKED
jgi:DNA polymerase-3 subunit gamma/tau